LQRSPSGVVTSFRLMSQHTSRGPMCEAAKPSREMRTRLDGPLVSWNWRVDQRSRIVQASLLGGYSATECVGSSNCDAMTLMTQPVPYELLRISSGSLRCHVLHLHFHALLSTGVGNGSRPTEASEKTGLRALRLELLQIRARSFPGNAQCQFEVQNPKQRSVAHRFNPLMVV
jgi:hypothetical protein